jgi:RNA polymerase sigma factor (sigma-70 family)
MGAAHRQRTCIGTDIPHSQYIHDLALLHLRRTIGARKMKKSRAKPSTLRTDVPRSQHRDRYLRVAIEAEQILEVVNKQQQAEDILELRARQAIVREQLEKLPTKYRIVLILRHIQEMTYEEMADILTLPIGTIKTHLFRARHLLKERLQAQHLQGSTSYELP